MSDRLFVAGAPSPVGGAGTELWHTLRLWAANGLRPTILPTWGQPSCEAAQWLRTLGLEVAQAQPTRAGLAAVEGLRGATVVSWCNDQFLLAADLLRELDCRLVWVNCMNWIHPQEDRHAALYGSFDRYVFQSEYQRRALSPKYLELGATPDQFVRIPGPLSLDEFPYRFLPHAADDPFTALRISRPDRDKFHPRHWALWQAGGVDRGLVLGWEDPLSDRIGPPPAWVEPLAPGTERPASLLARAHVYCQLNGPAVENWPQTVLEAMASGCPVVMLAAGGVGELVEHGETGYLAADAEEVPYYLTRLKADDTLRERIATAAQAEVQRLVDPERIWSRWQSLLEGLR